LSTQKVTRPPGRNPAFAPGRRHQKTQKRQQLQAENTGITLRKTAVTPGILASLL